MIEIEVEGGRLIIDPAGGVVHSLGASLMVEIPVQFRHSTGIEVGSVWVGTEPLDLIVREAHIWHRNRALPAHRRTGSAEVP